MKLGLSPDSEILIYLNFEYVQHEETFYPLQRQIGMAVLGSQHPDRASQDNQHGISPVTTFSVAEMRTLN